MKKSKLKIIQEIQASVPQEWRDKLFREEYVAPDLREMALDTLAEYEKDGETEDKDYKRLKNLFDAGYYDARELVVDQKMGKKIEDYVEKELKEAMKSGKLPKAKNDKELSDYVKKLHKYEREQRKSDLRDQQGG